MIYHFAPFLFPSSLHSTPPSTHSHRHFSLHPPLSSLATMSSFAAAVNTTNPLSWTKDFLILLNIQIVHPVPKYPVFRELGDTAPANPNLAAPRPPTTRKDA